MKRLLITILALAAAAVTAGSAAAGPAKATYASTILPSAGGEPNVTISPSGGFNGQVTLSVSGLPGGAGGTFTPNPATASSVGATALLASPNELLV